jgi:hypothetical protein
VANRDAGDIEREIESNDRCVKPVGLFQKDVRSKLRDRYQFKLARAAVTPKQGLLRTRKGRSNEEDTLPMTPIALPNLKEAKAQLLGSVNGRLAIEHERPLGCLEIRARRTRTQGLPIRPFAVGADRYLRFEELRHSAPGCLDKAISQSPNSRKVGTILSKRSARPR